MHSPFRHRRAAATAARVVALVAAAALATVAAAPAAPESARVLVLNMHAGKDAAGKQNLEAIAALIKSTRADVTLLQEVDRNTARSGGVDQVAVLQKATGFDAAFAASLFHYDGGEYGIAILSRYGIGFHATMPLPVRPAQTRAGGSQEPRVALLAFVQRAAATPTWRVLNTHLDPADGPARAQEIAHLLEAYHDQAVARTPVLVGGDFNSTPDNPVLQPLGAAGLRDAWSECGAGDGLTYPADTPTKRIDYLFLGAGVHCATAEVIDTQISDHRPLLVTLK
jgi:endonuclease/exonuclease/phosphatase family metal-dependent hydrolase